MMDPLHIPKHIAVIMDGNGRWAKEKGLPRTAGHKVGIDRVEEIMEAASDLGVKVITFFAFSTENWLRPKNEVNMLMRYLGDFLDNKIEKLHKKNVKFMVIGGGDPIPQYLQDKIAKAEGKTKDNTGLVTVLALNYGSRQEIVRAAKLFAAKVVSGEEKIEDLDIDKFSRYFFTYGLPDPDLLIRTSGEMRISNFLLWQLSYAELYFPKKYWPDFRKKDLEESIIEFQNRERRFGKINADKKNN